MVLEDHRYHELKELLPSIDQSVQALLHIEESKETEVKAIWKQVQELQEKLYRYDLIRLFPEVHEVVSFLYLCCFSLLYLQGESFAVHREEVNKRYKALLRWIYFFPRLDNSVNHPKRIGSLSSLSR